RPLVDPGGAVLVDRGGVEFVRVVRDNGGAELGRQWHSRIGRAHEQVAGEVRLERLAGEEVDELAGFVAVFGAAQDAGEFDLPEARRFDRTGFRIAEEHAGGRGPAG